MERRNNIAGLLLGCATGDALGVPYEFLPRGTFLCSGITGHGTHNQPAGTWSDDTSMTLCLAEAIAEGFSLPLLAGKFQKWRDEAYLSAHDEVFDIGCATNRAIDNIRNGVDPVMCGGSGEYDNGNGSLMRIAPMVFLSTEYEDVRHVSAITHAHELSVSACYLLVKFLEALRNGESKEKAYMSMLAVDIPSPLANAAIMPRLTNLYERSENEIRSSGFVLDTLQASLWSFLTTDSFRDAVLKAVNLGDDTDTTGAVTGAIAGLYYGVDEIPGAWLDKLARKDLILDIAGKMGRKV